jgi:hypothetical protein
MNAFEFLRRSEEIVACDDESKQRQLISEFLLKQGAKYSPTCGWYFEDERGCYKPTEGGRAIYFILYNH